MDLTSSPLDLPPKWSTISQYTIILDKQNLQHICLDKTFGIQIIANIVRYGMVREGPLGHAIAGLAQNTAEQNTPHHAERA